MSQTQTRRTIDDDEIPLTQRIGENPRPAVTWLVGLVILVALELGAVLGVIIKLVLTVAQAIPGDPGVSALSAAGRSAASIPTLLSRDVIPNQGYWNGQGFVHTFAGLSPAYAWGIRATLIYVYSFVVIGWCLLGYRWYRAHYRQADWTPRDDVADRLSRHRWGQFGAIIVIMFFVMAIFAPALGPTTLQGNIVNPYAHDVKYFDGQSDSVLTTNAGVANLQSTSQGPGSPNIGPFTSDDFGRYHPFGTLSSGKDLFTFMAYGSRISLMIGLLSIIAASLIAIVLSMLTAYYKGLTDLAVVVASDSIQVLPILLLAILASAVFANTWFGSLFNGSFLLIVIFSVTYWPFFWRAIRGPANQVSEVEWIDAAKSYGQKPRTIMRKHMLPYVFSYVLIYASLSLGGIIISVAALSFLGLGVQPPTPEWGQAVASGQNYVPTAAWYVSFIPGVLVTLVVIGFNAFGDGVRDALDPQSEGAEGGTEAAVAGGGGG